MNPFLPEAKKECVEPKPLLTVEGSPGGGKTSLATSITVFRSYQSINDAQILCDWDKPITSKTQNLET